MRSRIPIMERSHIAVENVGNLQATGKRVLEDLLGQKLLENQQVFIMVLSPGSEPDEAARRQARAGLDATFQQTAAYAAEHGIADQDIDAAVGEAREHLRSKKP
jgi:hypothetical protein